MSKATKAQLESQLKSLQGQIRDSEIEIKAKNEFLRGLKKEVYNIDKQLNALTIPQTLQVSDHALLRYMERVKGVDFNAVKAEMLSQELIEYTVTLGTTGTYPVGDVNYVIKDNNIVTILN